MKRVLIFLSLFSLIVVFSFAQVPVPPEPELNCRSAVLLDYETGKILFARNPDTALAPASMTKLVTAYTFLREIGDDPGALDEVVDIPREADYRSAPVHSSLMFLEEGQTVTGRELLAGLAIPSGNDAAAAVALHVSGSIDAFAELMNRRMEELDLKATRFVEPSGYSEYNSTTAAEFARFCREYIRAFPKLSIETGSTLNFTYPKPDNLGDGGTSTLGPVTQPNHNELIGRYAWADGLKTGYIEESGYNVALTAEKDGRRLICVIMGIERKSGTDASMRRVIDGVNLLSYGFYAFTNIEARPPDMEPLRVYGGRKKHVAVSGAPSALFTLSYGEAAVLRREYVPGPPLAAPVAKGAVVGSWKLFNGEEELGTYDVTAVETVEEGGFLKRFFSRLLLRFRGNQ